jgi:hypothetical protein
MSELRVAADSLSRVSKGPMRRGRRLCEYGHSTGRPRRAAMRAKACELLSGLGDARALFITTATRTRGLYRCEFVEILRHPDPEITLVVVPGNPGLCRYYTVTIKSETCLLLSRICVSASAFYRSVAVVCAVANLCRRSAASGVSWVFGRPLARNLQPGERNQCTKSRAELCRTHSLRRRGCESIVRILKLKERGMKWREKPSVIRCPNQRNLALFNFWVC